jgi:hypothetical protein
MAKIVEEVIVVKVSRLVKDGAPEQTSPFTDEVLSAIEQVTQELVGDGYVAEAVKA